MGALFSFFSVLIVEEMEVLFVEGIVYDELDEESWPRRLIYAENLKQSATTEVSSLSFVVIHVSTLDESSANALPNLE